jgi:hypothetical protein
MLAAVTEDLAAEEVGVTVRTEAYLIGCSHLQYALL